MKSLRHVSGVHPLYIISLLEFALLLLQKLGCNFCSASNVLHYCIGWSASEKFLSNNPDHCPEGDSHADSGWYVWEVAFATMNRPIVMINIDDWFTLHTPFSWRTPNFKCHLNIKWFRIDCDVLEHQHHSCVCLLCNKV